MHTRNAYMYFFFLPLLSSPSSLYFFFYINTTIRTKDTIDPRIPLATFRLFTKPCSRVSNYSIRYTCQRAPIVSIEVHPDTVNVLSVFSFFSFMYMYIFSLYLSLSLTLFQSFTFFPFQFSFNLAHYHRYK